MKIVHVINNLDGGGAEKLIYEFSLFQQRAGHNVIVIMLLRSTNDVYARKLIEAGIKVIQLNCEKYSLFTIYKLRKVFIGTRPDIIHSHLFPSQYYVILATIGMGVSLITTEHNTSNSRTDNKLFKIIEQFIYSRYSKIVAISDGVLKTYSKYLPKLESKIVKIENGINLEQFRNDLASKSYMNFSNETFLVTMVARFSEQKDQISVIKALTLLPPHIHLLLVGEGDKLDECRKLAIKLGLILRVHFLGFRTDIPKILSLSDIIVLSSFWEGFGLSIVEGMASSKPVIATNVSGLNEIVAGVGCLFEVGDYNELSRIIMNYHDDREYYQSASELSYLKAQKFNINTTNDLYLKLYSDVMRGVDV